MAFVKLDCGILNSTLWVEREPRDVFITALLMASPYEVTEPMPQFHVRSLEPTGFIVPPGWYGFVQAAGPGIVRMSMSEHQAGMDALEKLGSPDPESRSSDFEGRRLVRVDGGYIVLNFMKYRDKDMGAADRMRRYRQRLRESEDTTLRRNGDDVTRNPRRGVTKAEAEAEEDKEIQAPHPSGGTPRAKRKSAVERPGDVAQQTWDDWTQLRKQKKAPVTETVLCGARAEATKAGMTLEQFLAVWCTRGSQGLQADWLKPHERAGPVAHSNGASFRQRDNADAAESFARFTGGRINAKQRAEAQPLEIVDAAAARLD